MIYSGKCAMWLHIGIRQNCTNSCTPNWNADVDVNGDLRVSSFNRKRTHFTPSQCDLNNSPCTHSSVEDVWNETAATLKMSCVSFLFIPAGTGPRTADLYNPLLPHSFNTLTLVSSWNIFVYRCCLGVKRSSTIKLGKSVSWLRRPLTLWTIKPSNHRWIKRIMARVAVGEQWGNTDAAAGGRSRKECCYIPHSPPCE